MKRQNDNQLAQIHTKPLTSRMLQGGVIALVLISLLVYSAGDHPEWPSFWRLKPFVIVPISGALGGVFFYFMDHLRYQGGWVKTLANILSLLAFLVVLWLGTILALNGTMWN